MSTTRARKAPSPAPSVAAVPTPKRSYLRAALPALLVAGLCHVPAVARVEYVPGLLSVAAVAYAVLQARTARQAFGAGFAYISILALLLNYWMVPTLIEYTSGNVLVAVGCYLAACFLMAPFFGLQFALFAALRSPGGARFALPRNAALFAATWVLFEWGRAWLFSAVPFMGYAWGAALAGNTLLIQPAALGGVFLLSFLLVFPAYFLAAAVRQKRWQPALVAPALLAVQLVWGWIALRAAEAREAGRPSFKVALVQPAISSDLAWDPQQANSLVQRLLSLNRQAASGSPDLTVWTETVVPWTYRADDDFLNELTAATRGTAMHSLIGLNTRGGDRSGHNSVYLLNPAGAVLGRYDKQELLAGAERPFPGGLMLPFRALSGAYFAPGLGAPLPTPWGKGGVLLCNEGTVPAQAAARAQAGASWLAVVGNDAWFAGNYVPAGHFYQCRLRAVENRKDLLVNINQGPSGVVRASGAISVQLDAGAPAVHEATVIPNSDAPPSHLVFQIFILVLLGTCHRFLFNPQTNPQNKHV